MDAPLTPLARARRGDVAGNPVLVDGREWLLLDHAPALGGVWDELYDSNVLRGHYQPIDLQRAALRLLDANYDLTPDESVGLILALDPAALVGPVEHALFGPDQPHRRYSDWAESALRANGLDPGKVPPESLRDVLDQLVGCGRAVAPESFITMVKYAAQRKRLLKQSEW